MVYKTSSEFFEKTNICTNLWQDWSREKKQNHKNTKTEKGSDIKKNFVHILKILGKYSNS